MKITFLITFILISSVALCQTRIYPLDGNAIEINGMNGTMGSGSHQPLSTTDRNNNPNSALSFDGDDYISIPITGINTNEYSVSAWVTCYAIPTAGSNVRAWFGMGDPIGDQMLGIENTQFGDGFCFNGYVSNTDTFRLEVGGYPSLNTWYHVCGVYALDYTRLFVNGILIDSFATNGSPPAYGLSPSAQIGTRLIGLSEWFGKIDELRIYDRPLSSQDVLSLYVGVNELNAANNFMLFPNPASSQINIRCNNLNGTLQVYSSIGDKVMEMKQKGDFSNFNFSDLIQGYYHVYYSDDKNYIHSSFIRQKN